MELNLKQFASQEGYRFIGGGSRSTVSRPLTDSRSLVDSAETVFFALRTTSNDGHRYLRDLYRAGVRNFVIDDDIPAALADSDANFVVTPSVIGALQRSAAVIRGKVDCTVVGITGSRGKTVVKELLAAATSPEHVIAKSPRSWNSQIGVPLSLWQLDSDTTLGIFEAGISRPGEMERLEPIVRPTIGVFTSITSEHHRDFVSIEEKCREKAVLFRDCPVVIYPGGSELIRDTLADVCRSARLVAVDGGNKGLVRAVMTELGYDDAVIESRLSDLDEVLTRIDINEGVDGSIVAYDYYTNDIDGIATALDIVARRLTPGHQLSLIAGDLMTDGHRQAEVYAALEQLLISRNVDTLIGVGREIKKYAPSFDKMIKVSCYDTVDQVCEALGDCGFDSMAILLKGTPPSSFRPLRTLLEYTRHESYLEVSLDALISNYNYYRSLIRPETGLVAMIKADAYGAGAVEVAKTLQCQGADYLAVAVVEEGLKLREQGITMPVMVLNPISSNCRTMYQRHLEPTVFSTGELELLDRFAPAGTTNYPIHIKLDTGMHRFGFTEDELPVLVEALKKYPTFRVASIFSHLSTADCLDQDDYTRRQLDNFERMSSYIIDSLGYKVRRHILNTAGIMRYPSHQYDMVRLGIGLYGVSPVSGLDNGCLKPVSRLVTRVSAVHHREPGDTIGYARRGVLTRPSVIATLPIGYADGIDRHMGNGRASFIVDGVACPTVGNICMDICMIDVTDVGHDCCGAEVEIFGSRVPVTEVADRLDTIPYEVLTSVSPRVKRVYYRE